MPNSLQLHRLFLLWDSPGKNPGVGCHSLLQGIFPTQGSNPRLVHCRWIIYFWSIRKAQLRLHEVVKEHPQSSMFDVPIARENPTREGAHGKTATWHDSREGWRTYKPETPRCRKRARSLRRGIDRPPLPGLKRDKPAYTLITGIPPPELQGNTFLLFKPWAPQYFVMGTTEKQYKTHLSFFSYA